MSSPETPPREIDLVENIPHSFRIGDPEHFQQDGNRGGVVEDRFRASELDGVEEQPLLAVAQEQVAGDHHLALLESIQ